MKDEELLRLLNLKLMGRYQRIKDLEQEIVSLRQQLEQRNQVEIKNESSTSTD